MQFYWKCEECDETNLYPDVKVCETCGSPMTPAAEQRVLREQKEEEKRLVRLKKEQELKRIQLEREKQELERKRLEAIKTAKKVEKIERRLKKRDYLEKKLSKIMRVVSKVLCISVRVSAGLAVVATVAVFINNSGNVNIMNSVDSISDNVQTEYLAHTIVETADDESVDRDEVNTVGEKRVLRVKNKVGSQLSSIYKGVSSNVEDCYDCLYHSYDPGANISALVEDIVEYMSGGVDR